MVLQSYMPPCSSLLTHPHSEKVVGRGVRNVSSPAAVLMWSMCVVPDEHVVYMPNHIVLLQERRDSADMLSVSVTTKDVEDDAAADETMDQVIHGVADDSTPECDTVITSSDSDNDAADTDQSTAACSTRPLPDADWLDTDTLLSLLRDPPPGICNSRTPDGDKSNCYFVLSNTENVQRRKAGKARIFYDDCGAWDCLLYTSPSPRD